MRGGGDWLPILGLMIAALLFAKGLDLIWSFASRKLPNRRRKEI